MNCHGCGEPSRHNTCGTEWCELCFQDRMASDIATLIEHGTSMVVVNALINIGIHTVSALSQHTPGELLQQLPTVKKKRLNGLLAAFERFMQGCMPSDVVIPARKGLPARQGRPAIKAQKALTKADIAKNKAKVDAERIDNPSRVSCEPRTREVYSRAHNIRDS